VYAAKASQVHKVKCLRTGTSLALKLYWKGCLSARNHEQVRREARIHFDLDHRHIISLYAAFEDNLAYYFVLEWAEKVHPQPT
jgi:serine/threonine protein kinase